MKNIPINRIKHLSRLLGTARLFAALLLIGSLFSNTIHGQSCTCPVSSLIINTGYNPVSGTAIATTTQDPHWNIVGLTPACATLALPFSGTYGAFAVTPQGVWYTPATNSQWLSFVNFAAYSTPGPATGVGEWGVYVAHFQRQFCLCSPATVTINLSKFAYDNDLALYLDDGGTALIAFTSPATPGDTYGACQSYSKTVTLPAGCHTLDFYVDNWNTKMTNDDNGHGLYVEGTVSTDGDHLQPEVPTTPVSSGIISGCSTLCSGSGCTYTTSGPSGGTWSCSPTSLATINSSTGELSTTSGGTVTITYKAPGCSTPSYYTVNIIPSPTCTASSSFSPTPCVGSSLQLGCDLTSGSSSCTFSWTGPGGWTNSSQYPLIPSVSYGNEGTYYVTVTDPATMCSSRAEVTVDLINPPTVSSVPDMQLCVGTSTLLIASGSYTSEIWTSTDPTIASISGGEVNGVSPGVATIVHTVSNVCGTATAAGMVTVNPTPEAWITYESVCNPICPGMPITFRIHATAGALVTYTGDPPPPFSGPTTITMPGTSGISTYDVTVVSAAPMTSFSLVDVVLPNSSDERFWCHADVQDQVLGVRVQQPSALILDQQMDICQGDCFQLHIQGTPGAVVHINTVPASGPDILVTLSSSGLFGGSGVTPSICPFSTTTYQITAVEGYCCSSPAGGAPITVTVHTPAAITLSSNSPICEGEPLVLTATCPGCSFFQWNGGAMTGPVTTFDPTYTIDPATPADAGTYWVIAKDRYCETEAMTDVVVNPAPWATISCAPMCEYSTDEYVTLTGPEGAVVAYGESGSGATGTVTLPYTGTGSGTATITITPSSIPETIYIDDVYDPSTPCHVLTHDSCIANIAKKPLCTDIKVDYIKNTFDFPTIPAGSTVYMQILMYDGSYIFMTATAGIPNPLPSGAVALYIVNVTIGSCFYDYDCDPVKLEHTIPKSGGNSEAVTTQITNVVAIMPNPNNGSFTLSGEFSTVSEDANVEITDALGRVVYSTNVSIDNGKINKSITSDYLPSGVYNLKLIGTGVNKTIRFTISK